MARLLIIPLTLLVVLMYGIMLFGDDGDGNRPSLATPDETTADTGPASTSAAGAGGATTSAPPAPEDGVDPEAGLPSASPSSPPVEPLGIYQDGRLTLTGSVPTEELADRYRRRAADVVGADNIAMEMTLDPRASGDTLTIDVAEQFRFPAGRVERTPEMEALLDLGVAALRLLPESTLVITGHTDDIGDEGTNQALSVARAQLVVDLLVEGGIPADRVVARGAGESQPIAPNDSPEGREANRRVEATLEGITPG